MKFITVCLMLALPQIAAAGFTLISQAHDIYGILPEGGYHLQGASPQRQRADWSLDRYSAWVESYAGNYEIWATTMGGSYGPYEAGASSTYLFTVDQPALSLKIEGSAGFSGAPENNHFGFALTDRTTNALLASANWFCPPSAFNGFFVNEIYPLALDRNHEYQLRIDCSDGSLDGGGAGVKVDLQTSDVPAPGALVLTLLGAGLIRKFRH